MDFGEELAKIKEASAGATESAAAVDQNSIACVEALLPLQSRKRLRRVKRRMSRLDASLHCRLEQLKLRSLKSPHRPDGTRRAVARQVGCCLKVW